MCIRVNVSIWRSAKVYKHASIGILNFHINAKRFDQIITLSTEVGNVRLFITNEMLNKSLFFCFWLQDKVSNVFLASVQEKTFSGLCRD